MADLDDIRRGLAANLRTAMPEGTGHVSPYFRTTPQTPCLQVVGPDGAQGMVKADFGDGQTWFIVIEAVIALQNEIGAQKLLDSLITSVAAAVEQDNSPSGSLFDRYQDNNTILLNQGAAASSTAFVAYRGSQPFRPETGADKLLVASWLVEVLT